MKKTYKTIRIDKKWIKKNTSLLRGNRGVYSSGVNKFITEIRNGTFDPDLEISLVKGKKTGKFKVLDGQHRLEAIAHENACIEMDIIIREDMDDEEALKKCKRINTSKPWRLIDDIGAEIGKHDWLDALMEDSFPITISYQGGANSVRIDRMLNVIKNGFLITISRQNLTRNKLIQFLEFFDAERFTEIKDFSKIYKRAFGDPSMGNWLYARNTVMFTLLRVWLKNKDNFDEETIIKCFKEIENKMAIRQDATCVDSATLESMTRKIYNVLNKGRSVNKFEKFWDEE